MDEETLKITLFCRENLSEKFTCVSDLGIRKLRLRLSRK